MKSGLPSGWAVSFGAPTIAVPGSQTVTIATTANTPPGGYPVTLRALIDVDQDEEAQVMVTITP